MKRNPILLLVMSWMLLCDISGKTAVFLSKAAAESKAVLHVSGGNWVDDIDQYFEAENVQIDVNCAYADATDVQRIILAGIETPDVFVLDVDDGFWGLVQKEYLEPIADPLLMDAVSGFYPAIQSVLTNDMHQVIAVPEYFMPIHWYMNETLWNQIFGNHPYPETFLELAELLAQWKTELSNAYPEVKLLEFSGDSEDLILEVVRQYISQCENTKQPVVFQDEAFICTLDALRDLELQKVAQADEDVYLNQQALIMMQPFGGFGVEYIDGCRYVPMLPPRLTRNSPPYVPVRMRIMFVNPHSRNKELAYDYLSVHWEKQSARVKAGMIKNWETVVFSQAGIEKLNQIDQEIQQIKNALEKAVEADNWDQEDLLNKQLASWNEKREKALEDFCVVSQEDIDAYRAIGPHVNLLFGSPYAHEENHAMQSITRMIKQFVDGKMTGTTCAQKMGEIAQMVAKERE